MNVLKFGGTSVGSPQSISLVRQIVSSREESVIVVVSALGGVTDMLLETSALAERGDKDFRPSYERIRRRHLDLVEAVFEPSDVRTRLQEEIESWFETLRALYEGVYTLRVLPEKTACQIVSYGERISALIVSALIPGAKLYDSLGFIKSTVIEGKDVLDSEPTEALVRKTFAGIEKRNEIAVVPGFISTDSHTGEITNLGRGGSDYTASILAAALDAQCLEIWTDVDGFMTADPRVIKTSYVIDELSFSDAMELCNFGAKVIYPPAIYPVYAKDIPVLIKNTFNPEAKGTVIRHKGRSGGRTVTGISSIDDSCLITVSGTSMAGIIGVNSRIFKVLADNFISVFLVSQSSSETHISLGISASQADKACELLGREFAHEIAEGSMDPVQLMKGLATVAIVGENMKNNAGIAGKLFSVLGRNGISIIACAQGTEEHNISFVVDRKYLRKSLNVIHDSFFLSEYQELNIFVCGIGTVGGNLLGQIASQRKKLMKENNLKINVVGIARSTKGVFDREGIDLENWKELLDAGKPLGIAGLRDEVIGMNIFNSVFVDCTASSEVAGLYKDFFEHGISVVAANKVAASSDYDNYAALKALALKRGVKFLFETNVGAGLPIINTINALRKSGDKILKIEAVLSGTLNFIFNTLSETVPFSETVRMAKEQGFSEPDPRIDLSGKDVIRKLVILSREAGYEVNQEDVVAEELIPASFFDCPLQEFWQKLPGLDAGFEERRRELAAQDKHWRVVARMENGKYTVSLCAIDRKSSLYELEGSNNIILLTTERYNKHPMLIQGYGAGASVTAAGVFADIMSVANV
ncbi:MAG: bifunctional aspartate kinase/homoserine dehydrogenase I [Bacteroidales bacterium]|nr:bifunctional aspartate kinase/homoserine dehydrogenase I [Bacteroidales bacterium]